MAISDFQNFIFLTPENQNFDFSKKMNAKNTIFFYRYPKNGIYHRTEYYIFLQNFERISSFLALQWPKHWLMVMTSLFETPFLEFLIVVRQNKWHLGNRKTKLDNIERFCKKIFIFKILPLSELDLTLDQMWKWVSPSNSKFQMTHKTCVAWHSCYIFIRWPRLTSPWPWPVLSISLLFPWHLRYPFNNILTKFWLAASPGQTSAVNKDEKSQLWPLNWPWPNIWPR